MAHVNAQLNSILEKASSMHSMVHHLVLYKSSWLCAITTP